ncbi:MAG: SDR family oxidoreductase [Ferruginibacter sp.]
MTILLTGGSRGLGEAIMRQLAAFEDNSILFTYAKNIAVAEDLEKKYRNTKAFYCDFTDTGSVNSFIENIQPYNIDVLINNAMSKPSVGHFHKTASFDFLKSFEVNIVPVIKITSAVIKDFRKKKSGKIINIISSYVINKPPIGLSAYVANKNYLLSLSKSWAAENIRFNISSNCVSPSFMATDFTSDIDERIIEQMIDAHPLKRLVTPEEVAEAVVFLTSCSAHINGINLLINAGSDIA